MPSQDPSGPFISAQRLAAVPTAVGCTRDFVRQTLTTWQCPDIAETTALIASELVTNAVKATGITDPRPTYPALATVPIIRVRLSMRGTSLVIEVWDTSTQPPVLQQERDGAEHGRGLHIVHSESERWGIYFPKSGGKVVWAQIAQRRTGARSAVGPVAPPTRTTSRTPPVPSAAS